MSPPLPSSRPPPSWGDPYGSPRYEDPDDLAEDGWREDDPGRWPGGR